MSFAGPACGFSHRKLPRMGVLAGWSPPPLWAQSGPSAQGAASPVSPCPTLRLQWVLCDSHPLPCPRGTLPVLGRNKQPLSCGLHPPCEGGQAGGQLRASTADGGRAGAGPAPRERCHTGATFFLWFSCCHRTTGFAATPCSQGSIQLQKH